MFKLKLINKPKMMKLKCNFTFPNIVLANLQEKEATPTKEIQQIIADQQYDGLSKVVVNAIPDEYIIPNGDINIIENGTYDVKDKINAIVNIPEKKLGSKIITENGTYKASDDNLDGYSEVEVATSGVDINEYFSDTISGGSSSSPGFLKTIKKMRSPLTINGTDASYMFYNYNLNELPQIDTSNVTNMSYMFTNSAATTLDLSSFDTSKVTNMGSMFSNSKATTLDIRNFDFTNVTYYNDMFRNVSTNCLIIVKDDTAKEWITSKFTTLTNVKTVAEYGS